MEYSSVQPLSLGCVMQVGVGDRLIAVAAGSGFLKLTSKFGLIGQHPSPPGGAVRRVAVDGDKAYALVGDRVFALTNQWRPLANICRVRDLAIWQRQLVLLTDRGIECLDLATGVSRQGPSLEPHFEAVHAAGDAVLLTGRGHLALLDGPGAARVVHRSDQFLAPAGGFLLDGKLTVADRAAGVVSVGNVFSSTPRTELCARLTSPYAIAPLRDGWIALADEGVCTHNTAGTRIEAGGLTSTGVLASGDGAVLFGSTQLVRVEDARVTRSFPGFVWDISVDESTVAWATDEGVSIKSPDGEVETRVPGGVRAVCVVAERVWAAGPHGLWRLSGGETIRVSEEDGTEPVALAVDPISGQVMSSNGARIQTFEP